MILTLRDGNFYYNPIYNGDKMMNPNDQRIAIATACGWKDAHKTEGTIYWSKGKCIGIKPPADLGWTELPDYLNDLNACHEMRLALKRVEDRDQYESHLRDICGSYCNAIHATAAQRAEAFLKTLNLWKESK